MEEFVKNKTINLINVSLTNTVLFGLSLCVSFYIINNQKKRLEDLFTFTSETTDGYLNLANRVFGVLILLSILNNDLKYFDLSKLTNENIFSSKAQIFPSFLQVISGIIVLLIVLNDLSNVENPIT